jgi:hypothetical protein
MNEIFKNDRV